MISVKRTNKHLKYSPSKRRWNLDATSYGPALKLVLALILLAAFILLTIYVIVPYIMERAESGKSLFSEEPAATAVQETAAPVNPILTNSVKTVQFGEGYGLPAAVVDPSVYNGEILFATGASEDACDRLVRLNPDLPPEALEDAYHRLTRADAPSLVERNRTVHRMLVDGITVEYRRADGSIAGAQTRVLDFDVPENNDWLAVNQFTVVEGQHNRRPDVVVFVNGLPLVFVELKAVYKNIRAGFDGNLRDYMDEHVIAHAFHHNAFLIVSNGHRARYG